MSINSSMKPYGLYKKDKIGSTPTGAPKYGWVKISTIDVAIAFKSQFVDSKELNYRVTSLTGVTMSQIAVKEQCLVEGTNTPQTLEKLTGIRIIEVNPYARRTQLVLEKVAL